MNQNLFDEIDDNAAVETDDSNESATVDAVADLASLAVKKSLFQSRKALQEFKKEIETRVNEILHSVPVMHVKLNDQPTLKTTQRASKVLPRLIANAKLGLYTMLVGPAGCGKTTVAHQLSESLGLQFGSVCLTAGASETWLFGRQTPTGFIEGSFSRLYREGGVFLADEMDAADANLLLSINTALSHDAMLNPMNGENIKKHQNFIFVGAANTNGKGSTHLYTGRSRLDAATLDRMVIVKVDYDTDLEKELCPNQGIYKMLSDIRHKLKEEEYDEFVSTRAFISCHRQRAAGIPLEDIVNSLSANWGDAAKDIASRHQQRLVDSLPNKEKNKNNSDRETFYSEFVHTPNPSAVWRPLEWR